MLWCRCRQFLDYLVGKAPELGEMEAKDLLLAKVILDIHRKRRSKAFAFLPLERIHPVHAIDHETAVAATRERARILAEHREELLARKRIDRRTLARILPSVSWLKVVPRGDGDYIAYEGNGRLMALRRVFAGESGIEVEAEVYRFRNPAKMARRLDRVRRMNGLIP